MCSIDAHIMNYEKFVKSEEGDAMFFRITEKALVLILPIKLVLKLK